MIEDIKIAIDTCLASKRFHSTYIYGETSCGKTYQVEKALKESGIKAHFITTHVTPLALYVFLYKHRKEVVVLDDLDNLTDSMLAILKAALWEVDGKRQISWLTSSNSLADQQIPMTFEYEGKIIITCNNMNTHGKIAPMLARMLVINQVSTKEEFGKVCSLIFGEYGLDGYDVFKNNYINIFTEGLHLRNVLKYCEYVKQGFQKQADELFTINEVFKFFEVSEVSSVAMLRRGFEMRFGLGRATFFRHWKKYRELKANGW